MTDDKPWLSLSDEEPPERGLAELMAAARVKAEVMAAPPWWKRLFELVRRPPVLALATLLVLLGGVIIVGRHPGEIEAVQAPPTPGAPPPADPAIRASSITPDTTPPPAPPPQIQTVKKAPPRIEKGETTKAGQVGGQDALELAAPQLDDAETTNGTSKVTTKATSKATAAPADPLARCRAAAAKKDCATAKACAREAEKRDPSVKAGDDAALRSCL